MLEMHHSGREPLKYSHVLCLSTLRTAWKVTVCWTIVAPSRENSCTSLQAVPEGNRLLKHIFHIHSTNKPFAHLERWRNAHFIHIKIIKIHAKVPENIGCKMYQSWLISALMSATASRCRYLIHGWKIAVILRNFRKTKLSKSEFFFFFFFFFFLTLFQHTYNVQLDDFRFATYANIAFCHFTALPTAKPPSSSEHAWYKHGVPSA